MDIGRNNENARFFTDQFAERVGKREMDPKLTAIAPSSSRVSYIEHRVSKMDTLAGLAIMYGVEVADIKRLNGLMTDIQMFAHKTLQIPLPGKHPPSPILTNGSGSPSCCRNGCGEQTQHHRPYSEFLESFKSLKLKPSQQRTVSPAMSSLQGYYGLNPPNNKAGHTSEGTEMKVYRTGRSLFLEDAQFSPPKISPPSDPPPTRHRKTRSLVNGFLPEKDDFAGYMPVTEGGDTKTERSSEKSVRRRQISVVDPTCRTPELVLKEDCSGWLLGRMGKGLSLRPKSSTKLAGADMDSTAHVLNFPIGDSFMSDVFTGIRRSSSTSNLQQPEIFPARPVSRQSLRSDFQALSTASITRPIYDGLPKPIIGWRNKAALD